MQTNFVKNKGIFVFFSVAFLEVSALSGDNIQECFMLLLKNILNRIEDGIKVY